MKKVILIVVLFVTGCAQKPIAPPPEAPVPKEKTTPAPAKPPEKGSLDELTTSSSCSKINWKDRGRMPIGFFKTIAKTYARSICYSDRADVLAAKAPARGTLLKDALAYYGVPEAGELRSVYAILIGLAARESSGQYCVGRDSSANFSSADSAEAGLFQTSWGVSSVDPSLPTMTKIYEKGGRECYLDLAKEGFDWQKKCSGWNAKNWNKPEELGYQWQATTKACPAFAIEYAAVVLRKNGGSKGEFGPIRTKKVEIRSECSDLLASVEKYVEKNPKVCDGL